MTTITVLDSAGNPVAVEKPLSPGRAASAASTPVVLSTEQETILANLKTVMDNVKAALDLLHTDMSTGGSLPAGNAVIGAVLQANGTAWDVNVINTVPVSGPLTNAQAVALGLATDVTAQAINNKLAGVLTTKSDPPGTVSLVTGPATLAATSGSTPVTGVTTGSYIFEAQFTGTSVKLQTLGPDGANWYDVATLAGSGFVGVVVGNNATLRLYNPNGAGLTALYARIR